MTEEKAKALVEYLEADEERANALLELSAAEAAEKLAADGVNCNEDDLVEFAKAVQTASQTQDGELDEDALSEVAGGLLWATTGVVLLAGTIIATVGAAIRSKGGW